MQPPSFTSFFVNISYPKYILAQEDDKAKVIVESQNKIVFNSEKKTINFPLVMKLENENKCLKMHFYKKTRHIS